MESNMQKSPSVPRLFSSLCIFVCLLTPTSWENVTMLYHLHCYHVSDWHRSQAVSPWKWSMEMEYRNGVTVSPPHRAESEGWWDCTDSGGLTPDLSRCNLTSLVSYFKKINKCVRVVKISSGYVSYCFGFELFLATSEYPKQPNFPKMALV